MKTNTNVRPNATLATIALLIMAIVVALLPVAPFAYAVGAGGGAAGLYDAEGKEMYRLYNPNSGEHFYTSSIVERDHLISVGWNDEGIGWIARVNSNDPVYRLYNANAGDHHYTMSTVERDYLISIGWNDEGIGWYSDEEQLVPLFRQYNPNAIAGSHNYTTSQVENDSLVLVGWNGEGIGWYGVGKAPVDANVTDPNTRGVLMDKGALERMCCTEGKPIARYKKAYCEKSDDHWHDWVPVNADGSKVEAGSILNQDGTTESLFVTYRCADCGEYK